MNIITGTGSGDWSDDLVIVNGSNEMVAGARSGIVYSYDDKNRIYDSITTDPNYCFRCVNHKRIHSDGKCY